MWWMPGWTPCVAVQTYLPSRPRCAVATGVGVMRHTPYSHAEISCASVIPSRSIRALVKSRGHQFKMLMFVNVAM